jgi:hypothetical protein
MLKCEINRISNFIFEVALLLLLLKYLLSLYRLIVVVLAVGKQRMITFLDALFAQNRVFKQLLNNLHFVGNFDEGDPLLVVVILGIFS